MSQNNSASTLRFIKQRHTGTPTRNTPTAFPTEGDAPAVCVVVDHDDGQLYELYDANTSVPVTSMPSDGVLKAMASYRRMMSMLEHSSSNSDRSSADGADTNTTATTPATPSGYTHASVSQAASTYAEGGDAERHCLDASTTSTSNNTSTSTSTASVASMDSGSLEEVPAELQLFKTALCPHHTSASGCPLGPKCTFAHGTHELRTREINVQVVRKLRTRGQERASVDPNKFKIKMCHRGAQCHCVARCMFAHSPLELRERATNREATCQLSVLANRWYNGKQKRRSFNGN
eukprot:PhM_4_TR6288/c5_g1_i1/m.93822